MRPLTVFHLDMNFTALRTDVIRGMLEFAASAGYDAVLWELENKVRWETCPEIADPEAMSREEFRCLLDYAASLGLESIPLLQSFGHAEYVLMHGKYASLREQPEHPDCYCVSNPGTRAFLSSLIREYLELFGPGKLRYFHLGGDEAYVFGTCPLCSSQEKNSLYAQHIRALAESLLLPLGIRPGIWSDMVLRHPESIECIPKDFVMWDWNYGDGIPLPPTASSREDSPSSGDSFSSGTVSFPEPFPTADFLSEAGYDVILSSASRSWCDSPFLPAWEIHLRNIAGAAWKVRRHSLAGHCVTSWAIRLVPYELQKPLIDSAPRFSGEEDLLSDPSGFSAVCRDSIRKCWGLPALFSGPQARLFSVDPELRIFTAIQWNGLKDSTLPPPGFLSEKFRSEQGAGLWNSFRKRIPERIAVLEEFPRLFPGNPGKNPNPEFQTCFREAVSLKKGFWKILGILAEEETFSVPPGRKALLLETLQSLKRDMFLHLLREQRPGSAEKNALLVFQPLIEFCSGAH